MTEVESDAAKKCRVATIVAFICLLFLPPQLSPTQSYCYFKSRAHALQSSSGSNKPSSPKSKKMTAPRTHAQTAILMHQKAIADKDLIIKNLETELTLEQEEEEELIEVLESLRSEKQELEEHMDHLQADVQRFNFYHNTEERQHAVTKKKLEDSQTTVTNLDSLHNQLLEKVQALQSQIQVIKLIGAHRRLETEATIQGLQNSIQVLTNQNTDMHNTIDLLQEEDPEEDPEDPMEAGGDGDILHD